MVIRANIHKDMQVNMMNMDINTYVGERILEVGEALSLIVCMYVERASTLLTCESHN